MIRNTLKMGLALAVVAATGMAMSQPANARVRRAKMTKPVRLVPSQPKASFHPAPYGGPMMLVGIPPVPPGGGVLKLGLLPSSNMFKDVPVLGEFGL